MHSSAQAREKLRQKKGGFIDINQDDPIGHMLSKNGKKGETLEQECKRINVFTEYDALKDRTRNTYDEARFLILRGIVKMVKFDPIRGDMKEQMTQEEKDYWVDLHKDIAKGGELLYQFDGMNGMNDGLVWSFIPQRLRRDIDMEWNGIGEWKC
jgi:hypothetical protein